MTADGGCLAACRMGEQQHTTMQAAFADLPAELQSYVFACGAAPLHTCKASKAVLQDPYLAATWLLSNSANIQDPLERAMDLELWDACLHTLNTQEQWPAVKLYSALRQAASGGHLQLVAALLSRGAWAEWVWSVDHPQCTQKNTRSGKISSGSSIRPCSLS
jgi:hypothetical protein